MQALVTGSSGFVGRHIVRKLNDLAFDVVEMDIEDPGGDALRFFNADRGTMKFDLVVHCAAVVGGRVTIDRKRTKLLAVNSQLDAALFDWALHARPHAIIYISSSAVYPLHLQQDDYRRTRLHESMADVMLPHIPDASYGWSKLCGERLAWEYAHEGGRVHVVRPFSGYGADQDINYPFAAFLWRALHPEVPFQIWGNPKSCRDWIHIDDFVNALIEVWKQDVREPINICTGVEVTFKHLAHVFMSATSNEREIEPVTGPEGVFYRVGNPNKMLDIYDPQISIEEGVFRAVREMRDNEVYLRRPGPHA